MSSNDWPSKWPVEPIPTKPICQPYFIGDFQLHVWPEKFILHDCRPFKTFWFRIKNPLENVWVEYFVNISGRVRLLGSANGILKPFEESEPLGLFDGLTVAEDNEMKNFYAPPIESEITLRRSISIEYWHVDKEKVKDWKKGQVLPEKKDYRLTNNENPRFYPRLIVQPDFDPILEPKPFEEWKPVKDEKKKKRCVIL